MNNIITLKHKTSLDYIDRDRKKVFVSRTLTNSGLDILDITIGCSRVIRTFEHGQILSTEAIINGVRYGFKFIYDENRLTKDIVVFNPKFSLNENIEKVDKLRNSTEFFNASMQHKICANGTSLGLVSCIGSLHFALETALCDGQNTYSYYSTCNTCPNTKNRSNYSITDETFEEGFKINGNSVSSIQNLNMNESTIIINIDGNQLNIVSHKFLQDNTSNPIILQARQITDSLQFLKTFATDSHLKLNDVETFVQKPAEPQKQ